MTLWIVILWTVIALLGGSMFYLGTRIPHFFSPDIIANWTKMRTFLICGWSIIGFMGFITLCLDFVNAIICTLYLAMIWMISDAIFGGLQRIFHLHFQYYYAGYLAFIIWGIVLSVGWYLNHHVYPVYYDLTTSKEMPKLRIVMFADSHLGTSFNAEGFQKHLIAMQQLNPDIVAVVGDYVDDSTTKKDMIKATQALGKMKTKYGIYFVVGNHDKGYYGSAHRGFSGKDLLMELKKNGIVVLQDEAVLLDDSFYIIGRKDFSEERERKSHRQSMTELIQNLDSNKYMVVLDHQPADYENQAQSKVDLVLSGHTHGGQLFPLNRVGKWIKANDAVYGNEKRSKTDFIVTSGISSWTIRFKTGTKSEFVVVDIKSNK